MTNENTPGWSPIKEAAVNSLKSAIAKLRARTEIDRLGHAELERIARDVGLSPLAFRSLEHESGGWIRLLEMRLRQYELEKSLLESNCPSVVRDLEQTCARCGSAARCKKDFARSAGNDAISVYCPNTHTLDAVKAERDRKNPDAFLDHV